MPKPYDATSKTLLSFDPRAWLVRAGIVPHGPVTMENVDLSTITTAPDHVLMVDEPESWIGHIEFVSAYDQDLPRDIALRNALLGQRFARPALSIAILLHPNALHAGLSGVHETFVRGELTLRVTYRIVKA